MSHGGLGRFLIRQLDKPEKSSALLESFDTGRENPHIDWPDRHFIMLLRFVWSRRQTRGCFAAGWQKREPARATQYVTNPGLFSCFFRFSTRPHVTYQKF